LSAARVFAASDQSDAAAGVAPEANRPRVSIGVPVYNGARYLEQALESLLAQTYRDIEIVVSDNASTDGTQEIIRRVADQDPRVRYSLNDTNRGLVWNHRRVMAMSRGEYFMFAPHDDWFAREYVETCVAALDAHPSATYALAETILVDADGLEVGRERLRQRVSDPSPSVRFWDLLVVQGGVNWYGMFRRRILFEIGRYRATPRGERIVLAELSLHGPFVVVPGALYFRRVHEGQATVLRRTRRAEAAVLDPRRATNIWGTEPLLIAEYALGFLEAILRAPLVPRERIRCLRAYGRWLVAHVPGLAVDDARTKTIEIERTGTGRLPDGRTGIGY